MSALIVDFAGGGALVAPAVGVWGWANPGAKSKTAAVAKVRKYRYNLTLATPRL
jgi:hypothetical protein